MSSHVVFCPHALLLFCMIVKYMLLLKGNKLEVFENKVLRKIFEPKTDELN
jgi:hypothetical protein